MAEFNEANPALNDSILHRPNKVKTLFKCVASEAVLNFSSNQVAASGIDRARTPIIGADLVSRCITCTLCWQDIGLIETSSGHIVNERLPECEFAMPLEGGLNLMITPKGQTIARGL